MVIGITWRGQVNWRAKGWKSWAIRTTKCSSSNPGHVGVCHAGHGVQPDRNYPLDRRRRAFELVGAGSLGFSLSRSLPVTQVFQCPAKNFASSATPGFSGSIGRTDLPGVIARSNARLGKKSTICPARLPCCPGMVRIRVLKLNAGAILSFGRSPWGGGKDVLRTLAFR